MTKFTFNRLSTLVNAPAAINGIITQIESALDTLVSRNGVSPNQMTANLDMNNKRIYNLPAPQSSNDPVRLQDVVPSVNGISISDNLLAHLMTLSVAATNTISYTLPASVTIGGTPPNQTLTFNIPQANGPFAIGSVGTGVNATSNGWSASNQALWLVGTYQGSGTGPFAEISATDTANSGGSNFPNTALRIDHNVNSGAGEGNRNTLLPILSKNVAIAGTDATKKFYTPFFSQMYSTAGDGGSGGSPYGSYYGFSSLTQAQSGSTFLSAVAGGEIDVAVQTGASTDMKVGLLLASVNNDAVKGTSYDGFLAFGADSTTTAKWTYGITFGWPKGPWAFDTSSTLIGSVACTTSRVANWFIDGTNITYTSGFMKFPGGQIDASGNLTANKVTSSGPIATPVPVSISASTYTVGATDTDIIFNTSGACTVTLPTPSAHPGRELWLKTVAAQAINSASSNVQPLAGGALGTAILAATAGKWCKLKSDGSTAWIVMAGG